MKRENGLITLTEPNEIFVFGSNAQGNHAGGAARYAREFYGAIDGQGDGLHGRSYAIDTMSGFCAMFNAVIRFQEQAENHPELVFILTPIGCGIAGYDAKNVAPMFSDMPENVILPDEFLKVLTKGEKA